MSDRNEPMVWEKPLENNAPKIDRVFVDKIWETVDLKALRTYAESSNKNENKKMQQYVNYFEENGIDVGEGLKKIEVSYYRINGVGRRYASGPSLQRLSKQARKVAFQNLGFEIDMVNAGFSLLYLEIKNVNQSENYPIIKKLIENPKTFRSMLSEYYDEEIENSKLRIIKTLYGAIPEDDNPFLWKLLYEVVCATKTLLEIDDYKKLFQEDPGKNEKLFSKLFQIITISEDRLMVSLEKEVKDKISNCNVSLRIFDGLELNIDPCGRKQLEEIVQTYSRSNGVNFIIKER